MLAAAAAAAAATHPAEEPEPPAPAFGGASPSKPAESGLLSTPAPAFGGATSPSTEDIPDAEPSSEDEDAAINKRAREELQRVKDFVAKARPTTKAMHKNPARRFARPIALSDPHLGEEITAKLCERNPCRTKPWDVWA